jgi:hypothetical protein
VKSATIASSWNVIKENHQVSMREGIKETSEHAQFGSCILQGPGDMVGSRLVCDDYDDVHEKVQLNGITLCG